jgi:hypothetical protein
MTCERLVAETWDQAVAPGTTEEFEANFARRLANRWEPLKDVTEGRFIRIGAYDAECTKTGRTGRMDPRWSAQVGDVVPDGSAEWTIRDPSNSSLRAIISSVDWDVPEGISVSEQVETDTASIARLTAADDVAAGEYTITVTAHAGGLDLVQPCILVVA